MEFAIWNCFAVIGALVVGYQIGKTLRAIVSGWREGKAVSKEFIEMIEKEKSG